MKPIYTRTARRRGADITPQRDHWWDDAACAGHHDLYDAADTEETRGRPRADGTRTPSTTTQDALALCAQCPVRHDCEATMRADEQGTPYSVRAGLTLHQRGGQPTQPLKTKTCSACQHTGPSDEFQKGRSVCLTCHRARVAQRVSRHKAAKKAAAA